jgi:hypothetical protein
VIHYRYLVHYGVPQRHGHLFGSGDVRSRKGMSRDELERFVLDRVLNGSCPTARLHTYWIVDDPTAPIPPAPTQASPRKSPETLQQLQELAASMGTTDMHAARAAFEWGVPLADVTPEQRRGAKTMNYMLLYSGPKV